MGQRLKDKTALVTGSTSNIGKAIAIALAAEGARVVVTGRDENRGAAVVDAILRAGGQSEFAPAALDGSATASQKLAERATAALGGRIDILVNNAGIFPGDTTAETSEASFDEVYGVNVKAPFFLTAAIAPAMVRRGTGTIINLGSWITRLAVPRGALYASTKGALETLTRAWAAEYGPSGVRVNAISPGVILDAMPGGAAVHPSEVMMHGTPAGLPGSPGDIAGAAVYLASDDARFVHGATIDVDGGRNTVAVVATN